MNHYRRLSIGCVLDSNYTSIHTYICYLLRIVVYRHGNKPDNIVNDINEALILHCYRTMKISLTAVMTVSGEQKTNLTFIDIPTERLSRVLMLNYRVRDKSSLLRV